MSVQAKTCTSCGESKEFTQFHRNRTTTDGHTYHCKACESAKARSRYESEKEQILERNRAWREANRERDLANKRERYLRNRDDAAKRGRINRLQKYGLSEVDYDLLLEAQSGVCAICRGRSAVRLAVDHDHKTGQVRGLLCGNCNRGIGYLKDSADTMRAAIAYLESQLTVRDLISLLTQERPA